MTNILAVISDSAYASKIHQITQDAEDTSTKTLYVSLNKSYKSLMQSFLRDGRDLTKFFFIDTITATVIVPKPVPNCTYLPSADNVKALYKGIIKAVKANDIDMVIFDSLSSLTTYRNFDEIAHFVTTLLGSLSLLDCSAVFTCLKSDEESKLIHHMKMKVDKSYELS